MTFEPVTLIYDADCGFCVRSLRVVRALDLFRVCTYHGSRGGGVDEVFPTLKAKDLDEAMYAVTGSGRVYRGFFAFRRVLLSLPLAWVLLPFFYFPGTSLVGPTVYGWVARHRRRLGCSLACERPADSSPKTSPRLP